MNTNFKLTDDMSIVQMLLTWELSQIYRHHSKNTSDENWPSEDQMRQDAEDAVNSMSNIQLLEQMDFVINERKEQRAKRNAQV